MSNTFIGRGRGWLNLNENKNSSAPGPPSQRINTVGRSIIKCVKEDNIFVGDSKYEYLVNVVKQLNTDDDCIKLDSAAEKIKYNSLPSFEDSPRKISENLCGRGRGWLNFNENINIAPGIPPQPLIPVGIPPKPIMQYVHEDNSFVDASEYEFLLFGVEMLDMNDHFNKFNEKINYLLETWKEECTTSDEVEKSFQTLYQACLRDDELASKLVYMISSRTFISQKVRDKNIRSLFQSHLQESIDGSGCLHKTNPVAFRNCTRMLGEFLSKGRFVNGGSCSFTAASLVVNLRILLDNANPENLELLATQLYMNGFRLRADCPELLTKLLDDARIMLLSNELTKESKLWLLLCIEGANNEFGPLSADLYKFYQDHIGEAATEIIPKPSPKLSIQTSRNNKFMNRHQSNVNVHQLTRSSSFSQISTYDTSNTLQGYTSELVSSHNLSRNPRKPRMPIVGVGARLESYNDDTEASAMGGCEDQSNVNGFQVSSTEKFPQFYTSHARIANSSQGYTCGLVSDSLNAGKRNRPILGVGVRLTR